MLPENRRANRKPKILKSFYMIIAILILYPALASSESLSPLLKNGSCPSGYHASGEYCIPGNDAKFAIIKVGSCPSGYLILLVIIVLLVTMLKPLF